MYSHYIRVDEQGRIQKGFSTAFKKAEQKDILLRETPSRQFYLLEQGEENPNLFDELGTSLYKWEGGEIKERTQEEIEADRSALPSMKQSIPLEERIGALEDVLMELLLQ